MTAKSPISASNFFPYLPVFLLLAAALPLGLGCGLLWALGALGLAAICLAVIRQLQGRLAQQANPEWLLDEGLRQSQKLAAMGQLSAGLAHEINNPLAIIRQEAQWMQTLLQTDHFHGIEEVKELQEALGEIIRQVDRSKEITHNLLDFARKRAPVIQAVAVNRIIEDMAALVAKEAGQKGIKIIKRLAPDLPLAYADAPQLRQVVLNLLNNATYAIQSRGEVTITTRPAGKDTLEISISDTGPGIPPGDLPRIFDPFFTTKPPGQGTGLGLSICHGIIDQLGGRITAASEPDRGATFTISLPVNPREKRT